MSPTPSGTEDLDRLIDGFETAMLVTRSLEGALHGRPMVIAKHQAKGVLMFLTRADDGKLKEILGEPRVAITMQDGGRYLSLSGTARIDTDLNRIDAAWSPVQRLWFPLGAKDPELTLLVFEPTYAEFWDRSGLNRLVFAWEAGKALLTGEMAEAAEQTGHAKVELNQSGTAE